MGLVEFNEEPIVTYRHADTKVKGFPGLIISLGIVSSERTANVILVFSTVIFFLLSFILYAVISPSSKRTDPVPNDFQPGESVLR
jgi:hypothetical protein